jgi:hypothetical protein
MTRLESRRGLQIAHGSFGFANCEQMKQHEQLEEAKDEVQIATATQSPPRVMHQV